MARRFVIADVDTVLDKLEGPEDLNPTKFPKGKRWLLDTRAEDGVNVWDYGSDWKVQLDSNAGTWFVPKKDVSFEYEGIIEKDVNDRKINQAGLNLIKEFEGCRLKTYNDGVGVPTIGYGHTGPDVRYGMVITQERAEELLRKDLNRFEDAVQKLVKISVNDNQFAALVSFAFNVGEGHFSKSGVLRELNRGNYKQAAENLLLWNKAGSPLRVMAGLTRRRQAEKDLFLRG